MVFLTNIIILLVAIASSAHGSSKPNRVLNLSRPRTSSQSGYTYNLSRPRTSSQSGYTYNQQLEADSILFKHGNEQSPRVEPFKDATQSNIGTDSNETSDENIENLNPLFNSDVMNMINSIEQEESAIQREHSRSSRRYTNLDACDDAVCETALRQAHSLARVKLLREYIRDTVSMLDRLVTAVDSQISSAGSVLRTSLGGGCRAAQAVIWDLTKKENVHKDRSSKTGHSFSWYPDY